MNTLDKMKVPLRILRKIMIKNFHRRSTDLCSIIEKLETNSVRDSLTVCAKKLALSKKVPKSFT